MSDALSEKEQIEADRRRDELAKRVLRMPPQPKRGQKPKAGKGSKDETARDNDWNRDS